MPKVDINLPVSIFKEGDSYIAYTPALDVCTFASNFSEVKDRFEELVEIFLEELIDEGNLDEVLTSLGWVKAEKSWSPPIEIEHSVKSFSLPLSRV